MACFVFYCTGSKPDHIVPVRQIMQKKWDILFLTYMCNFRVDRHNQPVLLKHFGRIKRVCNQWFPIKICEEFIGTEAFAFSGCHDDTERVSIRLI